MKTITYTCDCCSKDIPAPWEVHVVTIIPTGKPLNGQAFDLCSSCASDIQNAIRFNKESQ